MTPLEEQLELELRCKSEELKQIKEVLALYLDKVYYDVDEIVPEDLELKLRTSESELYARLQEAEGLDNRLHAVWNKQIEQLCKDLGCTEFEGLTPLHTIKLFIKSLARENYTLKQMVGDKQTNGDSRTNNLRSSDTATS
jgi:hypothetical protein